MSDFSSFFDWLFWLESNVVDIMQVQYSGNSVFEAEVATFVDNLH